MSLKIGYIRYLFFRPRRAAVGLLAALLIQTLAPAAMAGPTHDPTGATVNRTANLTTTGQPIRTRLANGLDVTLYPAEVLAERVTTLAGVPIIPLDEQRYVTIIDDINDPAIYNRGDGEFHPFSVEMVLAALSEVRHPSIRMSITVYALPYPRRNLLVSSTSGSELFLSPHVLDINPAVGAYIVTHELGHAFHNRYLPDGARGWYDYRQLRGIEDETRFASTASHAYKPREIFAEDFRVLFGGVDAAYGGSIENPELPSPNSVRGLEDFFVALSTRPQRRVEEIVAVSYPNPFNPETTIRVRVPDTGVPEFVSVQVFTVAGTLVRDLYADVAPAGDVEVHWDGTDRRGNKIASAHYFARIRVGGTSQTLKLVMLK